MTVNGRAAGGVPTFVNGEPVSHLPVSDRGLAYGDGVFETIRVNSTGAVLYTEHMQRLATSCQRLNIPLDLSLAHRSVLQLIDAAGRASDNSLLDGIVKLIVTRGDGGRGYMPPCPAQPRIVTQWFPLPPNLAEPAELGIACALIDQPVSVNPSLAGMKHLNRLDQVLASQVLQRLAADRAQVHEVLMPSPAGWLIEGTRSNVFVVLDGELSTPDLSQAGVDGVMRQRLLAAAASRGQPACVRDISLSELELASEVFICNSVFGVWPVSEIWSGENAEVRLCSYSTWPSARWAQRVFETCLAAGHLTLPADLMAKVLTPKVLTPKDQPPKDQTPKDLALSPESGSPSLERSSQRPESGS